MLPRTIGKCVALVDPRLLSLEPENKHQSENTRPSVGRGGFEVDCDRAGR